MIIMLFDTSKLDISDEYKLVLQHLKGNEEKVCFFITMNIVISTKF